MAKPAYVFSTIGRKQMMALAGLGLCLFVLIHAAGNMLLFKSPEAYNSYSYALTTNHLIYFAEAGLVFIFLAHILEGVILTIRNRTTRTTPFAVKSSGPKGTSLVKRTMLIQGVVIVVFVVMHLIEFKFGTYYSVTYNGVQMRDLFRLVHDVFQSPAYVAWYVFAVAILCFHLSHGFYSSLQTLGFQNERYRPISKIASVVFGVLVTGMFAAQPIYMLLFYKGN